MYNMQLNYRCLNKITNVTMCLSTFRTMSTIIEQKRVIKHFLLPRISLLMTCGGLWCTVTLQGEGCGFGVLHGATPLDWVGHMELATLM